MPVKPVPATTFSFCESVTASGSSPWHIRQLTNEGKKLGGGIDTTSLCGHVKPPYGWDLAVPITEYHLVHACTDCVTKYRKEVKS